MKIKIAMVVSFAIGAAVLFFFLSLVNAEEAENYEMPRGECYFSINYSEESSPEKAFNDMREVQILKFPCVFKKGEPTKMTFNKEIVLEWPDGSGAGAMFTIQKGTTLAIKD